MKITILCVKPKTFKIGAYLILKFTKSGYSHVAISMKDNWIGLRKVFDSVVPSTRMLEMNRFMSHYIIVKAYSINIADEDAKELEANAVKALGTSYSFKGVWHQALKIAKIAKGKFKDGLSTLYCSEFVTWLVGKDISTGENMNLDEFDKWISERSRPVPPSVIESLNGVRHDEGILENDQA